MRALNPATGQTIRDYPEHTPGEVRNLVDLSHRAFLEWRETSFAHRAARMREAARVLRDERGTWARIMTDEMGKTLASAAAEVDKCAWVCEYYAENAERFLSPEPAPTDASESFVRFDPLGVVFAVMPWNFPF